MVLEVHSKGMEAKTLKLACSEKSTEHGDGNRYYSCISHDLIDIIDVINIICLKLIYWLFYIFLTIYVGLRYYVLYSKLI